MVIVKLTGGLGNQMFQYATARSLASIYNVGLKIDKNWFYSEHGAAIREYELDCFDIKRSFATKIEIDNFIGKDCFFRRVVERMRSHSTKRKYSDLSGCLRCNFFKLPKDIYLEGYYQSEKYFEEIEHIIRKDFSFKWPPSIENQKILEKINNTISVSIHIRRGDYVSDPKTKKKHGVCRLDYYKEAIEYMQKRVDNPTFFLFSDDIDWVRQNLQIKYPSYYIDNNQGNKSFEDMRLMSSCKYNIIANSTFSWWGAWLNNDENKIVIAPRNWFNIKRDKKDLIPKNWIRL